MPLFSRLAGCLYLVIIVFGFWDEVLVRGTIIVAGNAAATTQNLAAHETLWRVGFTGEITMWLLSVVTMTIFYVLLRPVNETLALAALVFNIMDTAMEAVNAVLCNFSALFLAQGAGSLRAFDAAQREALTSLALRVHEYGFGAGLLFFGICLVLYGLLIAQSGFFPRWLGILAAVGGACYAINSYALFGAPALADVLFPFILFPSLIAELSVSLWLILKGIDEEKYAERVALAV